jgi:hypothetical protein
MTYALTDAQRETLKAAGLAHIADASHAGPGRLVEVRIPRDPTGRAPGVMSEFHIEGHASKRDVWMGSFMAEPQLQVQINRKDVDQGEARSIINAFRKNQALIADFAKDPSAYRIDVSSTKQTLTKQG